MHYYLDELTRINGCDGCKIIYVYDGGDSSSTSGQVKKRVYSDLQLIRLLIKRTNEHKLDWIPYSDSMYDHYPFTLKMDGAIFTLTHNGRNAELRMNWLYEPDPDEEPLVPPKPPESQDKDEEQEQQQDYTHKDYVIIPPQKPYSHLTHKPLYVQYTDDQISVILDKWDNIKPYRVITSEWEMSVMELMTAVTQFCNKFKRKKTYWTDRYKETRKTHIDQLEEMNGPVDDDVYDVGYNQQQP